MKSLVFSSALARVAGAALLTIAGAGTALAQQAP